MTAFFPVAAIKIIVIFVSPPVKISTEKESQYYLSDIIIYNFHDWCTIEKQLD